MTQAQIAIRAAHNWERWGRLPTLGYLKNRGVPARLYYLARVLETAKTVN